MHVDDQRVFFPGFGITRPEQPAGDRKALVGPGHALRARLGWNAGVALGDFSKRNRTAGPRRSGYDLGRNLEVLADSCNHAPARLGNVADGRRVEPDRLGLRHERAEYRRPAAWERLEERKIDRR